jgi:hypothetical protein
MAWVKYELAAADLLALGLDKPILLGEHLILTTLLGTSTGGVWSTTGNTTDTSSPASGFHEWRAYDGFAHYDLHTKPSSSQTTWYLSFDLSSSPVAFDTLAIFGDNLDAMTRIDVEIADNATFSTRFDKIAAFTSGGSYGWGTGALAKRIVTAKLIVDSSEEVGASGVAYLRFKFTITGGGVPEVSEIWLGARRQLLWDPSVPVGDRVETTQRGSTHTRAGLTVGRATRIGRAERMVSLPSGDADELDAITGWWSDCDRGARSFLWIEDPGTAPVGYVMTVGQQPQFNPLAANVNRRDARLPMRECAPFEAND